MENLQNLFNIFCVLVVISLCFKWSSKNFINLMIKVSLFLIAIIGILLILSHYKLIK